MADYVIALKKDHDSFLKEKSKEQEAKEEREKQMYDIVCLQKEEKRARLQEEVEQQVNEVNHVH